MSDGTVNKCKECNKVENQKNWWMKREDKRRYDQYRHRYSIQRILDHRYGCIKRRCLYGYGDGRPYFVTGKKFLSKKQFMDWAYKYKNMQKFMEIYNNWVQFEFSEKLSPSIDRIDSKKSYVIGNLQWLTKSDNCKKYNH
jgi:hypothetical protein